MTRLGVILLLIIVIPWYTAYLVDAESPNDSFLIILSNNSIRIYFRIENISADSLHIDTCSLGLNSIRLSGIGFIDVNGSGVWLVTANSVIRVDVGLDNVLAFLKCVRRVLNGIGRRLVIAGVSVYSFRSKGGGVLEVSGELVFDRGLGFSGDGVSYALVVGMPYGFGVNRAGGFVEVRGNGVLRQSVVFRSNGYGLWAVVSPSSAWFNGLLYVRSVYASISIKSSVANVSGDLVACMVGYPVPRVELRVATGGGVEVVRPWVDYSNVTEIVGALKCITPRPLYMKYSSDVVFLEPSTPWLKGVIVGGDSIVYDVTARGVVVGGVNFSLSPYWGLFKGSNRIRFNLSSRLLLKIANYSDGVVDLVLKLLASDYKYNPEPNATTPICLDVVESNCIMYVAPFSPSTLGELMLKTLWDELERGVRLKLYSTTLFYDQLSSYTSVYTSRKPYLALALGLGSYNSPILTVTPRQLLKPSIMIVRPQFIVFDGNTTIPALNITMSFGEKYYSSTIIDSYYMLPLLVRVKANNLAVKSSTFTPNGRVLFEYNVSYGYLLKTSSVKGLWRNISSMVMLFKLKNLSNVVLNATVKLVASCIGKCSVSSIGGLVNITSVNGKPIRLIILAYGEENAVKQIANSVRITSGYGEQSLQSILIASKTIHAANGSLLLSWTTLLPPRNGVVTISFLPYIVEGMTAKVPKTAYPYKLLTTNLTCTPMKTPVKIAHSRLNYMLMFLVVGTIVAIAFIIIHVLKKK